MSERLWVKLRDVERLNLWWRELRGGHRVDLRLLRGRILRDQLLLSCLSSQPLRVELTELRLEQRLKLSVGQRSVRDVLHGRRLEPTRQTEGSDLLSDGRLSAGQLRLSAQAQRSLRLLLNGDLLLLLDLLELLRHLLNRLFHRHLRLLHNRHLSGLHVLLSDGHLLLNRLSRRDLLSLRDESLLQLRLCDLLQLLLLLRRDGQRLLHLLLIPVGRRRGQRRGQILHRNEQRASAISETRTDRHRTQHHAQSADSHVDACSLTCCIHSMDPTGGWFASSGATLCCVTGAICRFVICCRSGCHNCGC